MNPNNLPWSAAFQWQTEIWGKSTCFDFHEGKVQSHSWNLNEGRIYIVIADNKWFGHFCEDSFCSWWTLTPKHCCRTSSLLAGLFCKGDCWWGTGLWYNKNSESVAEFMTAGSEFFKRRSHLAWYQARLIPVLLHWFKPPHTFDSLVLMRLGFFFWSIYCCSRHLRPRRNVPGVGNSTGHVGFSRDDSVLAAYWVVSCLLAVAFSFDPWELWFKWEFLETLPLLWMITAVIDKVRGKTSLVSKKRDLMLWSFSW